MLFDHGTFTTAGIAAILTDKHQIRAFWNSLLLALLVGIGGTVIGFLFAFTAARGRLPRCAAHRRSTPRCCCRWCRRRSRRRSR